MSAVRLSKTQKRELVEHYRKGKTTSEIAREFGCSPNTVNRTVKALMPPEEYAMLKVTRARGKATDSSGATDAKSFERDQEVSSEQDLALEDPAKIIDFDNDSEGPLALDDADDFESDSEEDEIEDSQLGEIFQEVIPLNVTEDFAFDQEQEKATCKPLSIGLLPSSVYILVDKSVELETQCLGDFPEFGMLQESEKLRKVICLFPNPRAARRHCARNQRVIKVPDSEVFIRSTPYLVARGITRLVLEGALIALDEKPD